jgi:prepilin-type N-terminal cleavage/methylation domain-containing protein/prepilin-type processing-associated H-X9-DG protein
MRLRPTRGFTLVELLVVIGIIALLISILLPALNNARRQGNQVKCSSALKELGNAFRLYSLENRGYYPVAVYKLGTPPPAPEVQERRWQDMISKYIQKVPATSADDISKFRRNSVIWGCPAFDKAINFDEGSFADRVRNGYGMSYYPEAPLAARRNTSQPASDANPNRLAYIDYEQGSVGRFYKESEWTKKRSAARGFIADSNTHIIGAAEGTSGFLRSKHVFQNGGPALIGTSTDVSASGYIQIDASRHLKNGSTSEQSRKGRGVNLLFHDGHVAAVTTTEAYIAMRAGGIDTTKP